LFNQVTTSRRNLIQHWDFTGPLSGVKYFILLAKVFIYALGVNAPVSGAESSPHVRRKVAISISFLLQTKTAQ
jgi:hypothetical protein